MEENACTHRQAMISVNNQHRALHKLECAQSFKDVSQRCVPAPLTGNVAAAHHFPRCGAFCSTVCLPRAARRVNSLFG